MTTLILKLEIWSIWLSVKRVLSILLLAFAAMAVFGGIPRNQTLTWDAFDRLIKVSDRDSVGSGFDHASVYDGLGRRVRTIYTMVVSNTAITSPSGAINTVDSYYDPQVEFLEIATSVNGQFTFKTYGPDANGAYGGLNGVGGLEVLTAFGSSSPTGLIQDCFGNVVASVKSLSVTWNSNRVSSYGPVPGYQAPALSINVPLVQSLGWRGKRVDETGLINLGARVYDPQAGRFLSADPMGHSGSADLYSFADGDPVNNFDADGRFGREAFTDGPSSIQEWFNSTVLAPVREVREQVAFENQYVDSQRPDGAVASMFFDAIPLLGQAKMFLETLTGKDSVTGEPVNEYVHAALTVLGVLSLGEGWAGTETTFAGSGERGLVNTGEKVLPQTEQQLEFGFVKDNLSGNLSTLETGAAESVGRPAASPNYSVVVESKLKPGTFTASDANHFRQSNRQLYQMMQDDPALAARLKAEFPGIAAHVTPGPRGGFADTSPPGLTWHHDPQTPGNQQLVPRDQHRAPGPVQDTLHPGQKGGRQIWGGGR